MNNKRENKEVFVARNCTRTSGLTADNLKDNLASGEIVLVDKAGNILTTEAEVNATDAFRIFQGTNGEMPRVSDLIRKEDIEKIHSNKYVGVVEKKTAVGFNGVSGAVELNSGDKYSITVDQIDNDGKGNTAIVKAYHTVTSSDTQMSVLNELAVLLTRSYESFDYPPVNINLITEGTGLGLAAYTGVEAVKGVKSISYGVEVTALNAGDFIQIDAGTSAAGEDEFDGVYKIESIDAVNNIIILDRAFQNETISGADAALVDTADDAGLIVSAEFMEFNPVYEGYFKNDFEVLIDGWGNTTFTDTGVLFQENAGNGRHEQVTSAEVENQEVDDPNAYNMPETTLPYVTTTVGNGYSALYMRVRNSDKINIVQTSTKINEYVIFFDRGTYADIKANAAGTAFNTNIITGTGLAGVDGSSIINILNQVGEDTGLLGSGANTVPNGGNNIEADGIFSAGIDL